MAMNKLPMPTDGQQVSETAKCKHCGKPKSEHKHGWSGIPWCYQDDYDIHQFEPAESVAVPPAPPELEYDRHRDKLTPYWQKKVNAFRVEIAEQDDELNAADKRIKELESELRALEGKRA